MLNSKKKQHGFSMIEVLVSLVVIGIGVLGLTSLQVTSMKGTANAHSRTIASMIAMELGDRMRANELGVAGGFYANDVNCTKTEDQCRASACTPQEIARIDVQEVMCGVLKQSKREGGALNSLPNGSLAVSCVGGCALPDIAHDVTISWNASLLDQDQASSDAQQSITVSIIP